MKISYNWLKNYIDLKETPEKTGEILTSIGLETESLERFETVKGGLRGVVAGRVIACEKHPDADKLKVTVVDTGTDEHLQIVCGAPNVEAGQKVAVATVGTTLYFSSGEEIKIKKSKIRGVESFGMICAEDELGIGTSHEGIMVLDPEVKPGTPLNKIIETEDDYVFEIGLTPNRGDAASHIGVARDLAAYLKIKCNLPDLSNFTVDDNSYPMEVKVDAGDACIRYSGITVSGIKVAPSPDWLQNKLRAAGINPKNNVVDITNYVLHEYGQPLHAFDADKTAGKKITVRTCRQGTEFVTLDGQTRKLDSADLMICDDEKPMCIAGVSGGKDSGVTENTRNIFIESACFNPVSVRRTARRHDLHTDSSFRFERGVDPSGTVNAVKRAAMLIKEWAGGKISSDVYDVYPKVVEPSEIELSYTRTVNLIGKNIPKTEICKILKALDIDIVSDDGEIMKIKIPTYRIDVKRECDAIEDILRIYGYDNIEIPEQVRSTLSYAPKPDTDKIVDKYSDFLSSNGFNEIMSNSLTKSAYYDKSETYGSGNSVKILNPLSADLNVMRQTLLFGGLEAIARNINRQKGDLKLYENGNCYYYNPNKADGTPKAYGEEARLALFICGNLHEASWNQKSEPSSFFALRAIIEKLFARFGIDIYSLDMSDAPGDIFSYGITLKDKKGNIAAEAGAVSKQILNAFDINKNVYFAELRRDFIVNRVAQSKVSCSELPRFPEVRRDLALVLNKNASFAELRDIALRTERKLKNVGIFDIYEGDKLPEGKKQYALSFTLQDKDKTLTDSDIDKIMNNLAKAFETSVGATLRT